MEGIEDEEEVEESKVRAPLTKVQKERFRLESVAPWEREKKGEGGSASSQAERNWDYPRQKKGPVAKKAVAGQTERKQRKKNEKGRGEGQRRRRESERVEARRVERRNVSKGANVKESTRRNATKVNSAKK